MRTDTRLDQLAAHPAAPVVLLCRIVACGLLVAPVSGLVAVTGMLWDPLTAFGTAFTAQMAGGVRHPERSVAKTAAPIVDNPFKSRPPC